MKKIFFGLIILILFLGCTQPHSWREEPEDWNKLGQKISAHDIAPPKFGETPHLIFEEISFRTADLVDIKGDLYTPDNQEEEKIVILLHMLGKNRKDWKLFARKLRDQGFVVLAIDLRGHGESTTKNEIYINHKSFSDKDWQECSKDVDAAWYFLKKQGYEMKNVSIVGASIGANLALVHAADNKDIKNLVLMSPSEDYRSIKTFGAMKEYGERPVLMLASEDDEYSATSVLKLKELSKGQVEVVLERGAAHGTNMFALSGITDLIVTWLNNLIVEPVQKSQSNITEIFCDAQTPCPEKYDCYMFPNAEMPVCAKKDPCSYYICPEETDCIVAESYPMQVFCTQQKEQDEKLETPVTNL